MGTLCISTYADRGVDLDGELLSQLPPSLLGDQTVGLLLLRLLLDVTADSAVRCPALYRSVDMCVNHEE